MQSGSSGWRPRRPRRRALVMFRSGFPLSPLFFWLLFFWLDSFHRIFGIGAGRRITRFVLFFVFFFCVAQPEMRTHTKRGGTIVSKAKFSEKKNEIGREKRISRLAGWWNGPEVEGRRYKWSNSNGTHASHRRADFGVVYPTESDSIWVTEGSRTLDGSLMWKQKLGNSELFSSSLRPKKRKPHNQSKKKKKRAGWVFFFFALSLSLSRAANDEWRESDKIYLNCFFFQNGVWAGHSCYQVARTSTSGPLTLFVSSVTSPVDLCYHLRCSSLHYRQLFLFRRRIGAAAATPAGKVPQKGLRCERVSFDVFAVLEDESTVKALVWQVWPTKKKGTDFEDFFKKWNRCFIGLDSTLRHGRLLAGRGHVTADRWVTAAVFFGNSDIKITHPIGEWFIGQVVFHHRTCRATRTATFEGFSFFFFFFYFFFFYFFFFYFPSGDPPSSTPPPSVLSISQSTTEASVHVGRR